MTRKETIRRMGQMGGGRIHNGCEHCAVEWEAGNMTTVGEEFGLLIIPMEWREESHFDECYQWVSNL